jgi:hypothetical protein
MRASPLCTGGHVHGRDVAAVALEALLGPVVSQASGRVGVPGGDPRVTQADTGVELGGHQRCLSTRGSMREGRDPAVVARRRSRPVAAWRSIRQAWVFGRIGPAARVPMLPGRPSPDR